MPGLRRMLCVSALTVTLSGAAAGQWITVSPFAGGAILVSAQGFARPPVTSAVATAYAHLPVGVALIGALFGTIFVEPDHSRATYAVATVACAQRRALGVQVYPYVALGSAAFRTEPARLRWRPAFGAGFGMDALTGSSARGLMLGGRFGYLTRSLNDDQNVAYAAIGIGFGMRRAKSDAPRPLAAR